jgi:hypothetical protein
LPEYVDLGTRVMSRHDVKRRRVLLLVVLAALSIAAGLWGLRARSERPGRDRPPTGPIATDPRESRGVGTRPALGQVDPVNGSHGIAASPNEPHVTAFGEAKSDAVDSSETEASDVARPILMTMVAAVPPEPGFLIRGKVVRSDGTPYNGETAEPQEDAGVWPESVCVRVTSPDCDRSCQIDERGRFECAGLDAATYVVCVADTLGPHRLLCHSVEVEVGPQAASEDVVLVVGREVPVAVSVVSRESLELLPDYAVAAELVSGQTPAWGVTDELGRAELSLIPGRYYVYLPQWEGDRQTEVSPTLVTVRTMSKPMAVELRVPAAPATEDVITGVLVDSAGNPVKGYVDIEFAAAEVEVEPAEYFSVIQPYHCPPEGCFGYAQDVPGRLCRWFLWQPSDSGKNLAIVLEPTATIVGSVADAEGQPVPDAHVDLQTRMADGSWRSSDRSCYTPTTGGQSGFQFESVPVGLPVRVFAFHGAAAGQSDPLRLEPGRTQDAGTVRVRLRKPETGTVRGRLTDENGLPIALCTLFARMGKTTEQFTTDAEGRFVLGGVSERGPVTVAVRVLGYGTWQRTAFAGDTDCDFAVYPQGWGIVGEKATDLIVDRWFNHAPMMWDALRGRVVLLAFHRVRLSPNRESPQLRNLHERYSSRGLTIIVVFPHVPPERLTDPVVGSHVRQFSGTSIAGCFDADPNMIAELMPPARPSAAEGATHWLYQVHSCPAYFLIDKQGVVRCNPGETELEDWVQRLLEE